MVKKESAKRGYMTPEEVKEHFSGLKTEKARRQYFNRIMEKSNLLAPKTRKVLYSMGAEAEEEAGFYDRAGRMREYAGEQDKAQEDYLLSPRPELAGKMWERFGNKEKAAEAYEKILNSHRYSRGLAIEAGYFLEHLGKPERALKVYEKVGAVVQADRIRKILEKRQRGLEKTAIATAIIGLVGGLFFLSSNITGNAIANVNVQNSSIIGAILLVVGLVAGFFYLKRKK